MAALHPQLAKDCLLLGHFPLCRLLLMNDTNYPWFILVPNRDDVSEIYQLEDADQALLIRESSSLSACLMQVFKGDKLNVAALGNIVPQLHIHHIVRYKNDSAWPGPVWGKVPAEPYTQEQLVAITQQVLSALPASFIASNG
jgi:diadenosine tetraphosphate (Ap4A) HIT family hydrolase